MPQQNRVVVLEFNELCPSLMARFMESGELPYFRRFHDEAEVYQTDAKEHGELLNPWVQWVTVHTGLPAREHRVMTLSEGHKVEVPAVWDILSAKGMRVWICGSMNTRHDEPLNGYLLTDPWSTDTQSYPSVEFHDYVGYVRQAVQEHTGGGGSSGLHAFVRFMLGSGLSATTVLSVTRQLVSERLGNTRWKRASLLDLFQFDVFRHYYRKSRPDFATFFLNSTAHFQHCYWRHMEPERFHARPSEVEQKSYANAILFGYKSMDRLLGRFMQLAGSETTLIFCTALSQQPYLGHEETEGRHYYHVHDKSKLVRLLGLRDVFSYEPVMAEQFYLRFNGQREADEAEARLVGFHVKHPAVFNDKRTRLFHLVRTGNALLTQCRCVSKVPLDAQITSVDAPDASIPFYDVFYQMPAIKSGGHHPDGMFWIRHPDRRHRIHEEKVDITSIAPTILRLFDVEVPNHMQTASLI